MRKSYSIINYGAVGCGNCHKMFQIKTPIVINRSTDPKLYQKLLDLSFFQAKCKNCGHSAKIPASFLYHDPQEEFLCLVIPYDYYIRYLYANRMYDDLLEKYLSILPEEEKKKLKNKHLEKKIIPTDIFLLKIGSPKLRGNVNGAIHFTPFPKLSFPSDFKKSLSEISGIDIQPFEVGISEANYPDGLQTLIKCINPEMNFRHIYLPIQKAVGSSKSIGTYGIPELLILIASNIVVPIFVGVLSSLISTLILEKKKKREELENNINELQNSNDPRLELEKIRLNMLLEAQKNDLLPSDKIDIRIINLENNEEYVFSGTYHEITRSMKKFRKETLNSIRIPGNCHICNFVGNKVLDLTIGDKFFDVAELESRFGKFVSKDTRVRFIPTEDELRIVHDGIEAAKRAKSLMNEERYEEAIQLLLKEMKGESTCIDVIFNLALCLNELGYESEASNLFEQVLIRMINLPSLKESSSLVMGLPINGELKINADKIRKRTKKRKQKNRKSNSKD